MARLGPQRHGVWGGGELNSLAEAASTGRSGMASFWINVRPKKLKKAVKTDSQVRRSPGLYLNRRPLAYKENLLLPSQPRHLIWSATVLYIPYDPVGGSTYQLSVHDRYCHVQTDTGQEILHVSLDYPPFNRADRMAVSWP